MSDKEMRKLVDLLSKLANCTELPWQYRKRALIHAFDEAGEDAALLEVVCWFDGVVAEE